jgi:digeranylgeranylglycerophospholipid reductase
MYDVIITGGGPVGSLVARRLAIEGHKVLVLEKKRQPGTKTACTGIIGQECAGTFNIDERAIIRRVNSASLFSPSGKRLYVRREEPQACILDRTAFDIAMAERAQEAGAEYRFESRVQDIAIENARASIKADCRGKKQVVTARVAVIASGFNPGLLGRLGLGKFRDHTLGVQAEVEAPACEEVEVYFGDMAPGFFAWLVPTQSPLARAGLLSRENPDLYLKKWLADLKRKGRITTDEVKVSYGGIPLRPLSRTSGERIVVVGEAAGQVKPISGGGIYYGLLGAEIAAEVLHRALEDDDLSTKRLARYDRGWHKKLGREIRTGYWFRKVFERLSDRQIDRIFEMVKARGIDETLLKAEDVTFDWHGRTIIKLLKYQMIAKTFGQIRLPFRVEKIDR